MTYCNSFTFICYKNSWHKNNIWYITKINRKKLKAKIKLTVLSLERVNLPFSSETYSKPSQASKTEFFAKRFLTISEKTPSYMLDWVLNTSHILLFNAIYVPFNLISVPLNVKFVLFNVQYHISTITLRKIPVIFT